VGSESGMRIVFTAWRDLAHPQAGGSEMLVNRLLEGIQARGHSAALLSGGPVAPRPYAVIDTGGAFTQYLRSPLAHLRRFRHWDLLVDVENGIPFYAPLWRRRPVICLVHHVHRDQWPLRFPGPLARVGWFLEGTAMPRLYRRNLFIACSPSTAAGLQDMGVEPDRIRALTVGTDRPTEVAARSKPPLFLALGRLVPHKRIDLLLRAWERVFPRTGGTLVIAGDGPEGARLRAAMPEAVRFLGTVSENDKWRLMSEAWLLVHPAMHEGWGIVVMEAAAAGTPALAFDVSGLRDSVVDGETGELAHSEDDFVARWIALAGNAGRRAELGRAAIARAQHFTWDRCVDRFLEIAEEAVAPPRTGPGR
jgi:glycosyltransferase involved in cell wall biosynthesis